MLIRFRVKNFLSFKDEAELSMIPGKTRQHAAHILSGGESRNAVDILRAAVVYGANASGKSNLVKAIAFARDFILQGTRARQAIPVRPFKLDQATLKQPSRFEFELRTNGRDYLYGFEVDARQVWAEWLYEIKLASQSSLFERRSGADGKVTLEFGSVKFQNKDEENLARFVGLSTRANQLFLTESFERGLQPFEDVHNWFATNLVIIFPEMKHTVDFDYQLGGQEYDWERMGQYLEKLDTGISGFELEPVALDAVIAKEQQENLSTVLTPGSRINLAQRRKERLEHFVIAMDDKRELAAYKLKIKHKSGPLGETVLFDTDEESDGTLRLMDLIPILYDPGENKPVAQLHMLAESPILYETNDNARVIIIDELDRSLHPNLCYQMLELFLAQTDSPTQIIVTTYESNLLDFDLLRRDEIWFTEKDPSGATSVYSLEEFTPRYDKDIQKGYLLGRFGAIPIIGKKQF